VRRAAFKSEEKQVLGA